MFAILTVKVFAASDRRRLAATEFGLSEALRRFRGFFSRSWELRLG